MPHPFEHFYRVWEAQELIDYAFSKASSKTPSLPQKLSTLERTKRKEMKRIENTITILIEKLKFIIQSVPSLESLPEFYRRLSHLLVNNDELRMNLGRLNGIIPVLTRLSGEYRRRIAQQESNQACADLRVEFFGRSASIVTQQASTFLFLEDCRIKLQQIPIVNLQLPSVVIAGYPNVGKSTLVGKLSSAQPQIAEYPFTTKQIYIGLYTDLYGSPFFQVIDTPGVLDRPMEQRNVIERQAILALNTIASVILFIIDPTMTSGYELSHQIQLYNELTQSFIAGMNIPFKVVINKIDIATPEELNTALDTLHLSKSEVFLINAKDGQNVKVIQDFLLKYFKETNFRR